jgi:hypothetical protein
VPDRNAEVRPIHPRTQTGGNGQRPGRPAVAASGGRRRGPR